MNVSRIYRLLRLITLLQSGRGYTVRDLAAELEVSRRTVFRDLNMLEMARVPYYHDPQRGGYHLNGRFFLPPVNLTLSEALAVLSAAGPTRGPSLPLAGAAAQAALKLESALPEPVREHVGSVLRHLDVRPAARARQDDLDATFQELAEAIVRRRVCRMVYISFLDRRQIDLQVHPLRLVFVQRAWYLRAFSCEHREVRTFKLGRIRKLERTPETFGPPAHVADSAPFGQAWGMIPEGRVYEVQLHFAPKVAGNVAEVQWHPSQQVSWNDDGSLDFRVLVDGLGEITWWILGYGDQVTVVRPRALRKRVADVAANMLRRYHTEGR